MTATLAHPADVAPAPGPRRSVPWRGVLGLLVVVACVAVLALRPAKDGRAARDAANDGRITSAELAQVEATGLGLDVGELTPATATELAAALCQGAPPAPGAWAGTGEGAVTDAHLGALAAALVHRACAAAAS